MCRADRREFCDRPFAGDARAVDSTRTREGLERVLVGARRIDAPPRARGAFRRGEQCIAIIVEQAPASARGCAAARELRDPSEVVDLGGDVFRLLAASDPERTYDQQRSERAVLREPAAGGSRSPEAPEVF